MALMFKDEIGYFLKPLDVFGITLKSQGKLV